MDVPDAPDKSPVPPLACNACGANVVEFIIFGEMLVKTIHDPSQQRLFDPFEGVIGRTGWKLINGGWQSLFRDVLLEQMPVQRIGSGMSDSAGRPSVELHAIIGLVMIRELYGWTVPETREALLFRSDIGKKFDDAEVGYDQFELNDANEVVACPAGHSPKSTRYNEKQDHVWAQMDAQLCRGCPLAEHCRVQKDKDTGQPNGRIQFRSDAPAAARRRRVEQTDEFRDSYRWRSGIESINSSLKRRPGLGRLPVRGMKAVKLCVLLKLTAWNILRATHARANRRNHCPAVG